MGGVKDRLSFSLHFLYIYIYFTDAFCVAIAIRQLDRDQIREGDVSRYLSYPSIESCRSFSIFYRRCIDTNPVRNYELRILTS